MLRTLACLIMVLCLSPLWGAQAQQEQNEWLSQSDQTLADPEEAVDIVLTGESLLIDQPGVYRLSGTIENGSVTVRPEQEEKVWLLLDGVTVHNENGAALLSDGADKLILTLAEGSVNTFSQGAGEPTAEDNDAAIFSRDDLTINGSGALVVEGYYRDGINCRDSLRVVSGSLTVTALEDAVVGKDEVTLCGGDLTVVAQEGDAIKSTNDEDADRGFVVVSGASVSVTTGGGAASAQRTAGGGWGGWTAQNGDDASQKGLKAETRLIVESGTIVADTVDDALHCNADVAISGASLTLSSGDDAVHADNALTVSGGSIRVLDSYEGLEGAVLTLSGGEISIVSSDDGINGAGGGDASAAEDGSWAGSAGRFGRDRFSSSTGSLAISGGVVTVQAGGDGIDVNGSITFSGGELYVYSTGQGDGALDYDGSFAMTGGTLLAAGPAGMAMSVSEPGVPGTAQAVSGSGAVEVVDAGGQTLARFEVPGAYSHVVVYSDSLIDGQTYTLSLGETAMEVTMTTQPQNNTGFGGGGRGGTRNGMPGDPPANQPEDAPDMPQDWPDMPQGGPSL